MAHARTSVRRYTGRVSELDSTNPRVSVIVVPRESFAHASRSLDSLYADPGTAFELFYVDGGMPARTRRTIERQARRRGFELLDAGRHATPNHSRNVGLARVRTEFVAIVDNDVLFAPNWLAALIACAEETGADVVGPLVCIGDPPFHRVHSAGGHASVEGPHGERRFEEVHRFIDRRLTRALREQLVREPVGLVELHCMLVRRSIFERVGIFDEGLSSAGEHADFCMRVRNAGGSVCFDPAAMVNQLLPLPFPRDLASLPFFLARWSSRRNQESLDRLREVYGLAADDPGLAGYAGWLAERRELMFSRILQPLRASPLLRPLRELRLAVKQRADRGPSVPSRS
jgi:GT2 family glycosyltransferase